MTTLAWIVVVVLLLAGSVALVYLWATCALAKQTQEWMDRLEDEWEVGG